MCSSRYSFDTYESCDRESIFTIGMGTMKIRMHDGIVRTLMDVKHVLELRRNLIYVGALDSKGCKCTTAGGVIKVVRGAMVVMKGEKVENLYKLKENTIVDGATSRRNSKLRWSYMGRNLAKNRNYRLNNIRRQRKEGSVCFDGYK